MSRELEGYLAVYITTNVVFNLAWLHDGHGRFYWPIIAMVGWGIVLALYAWDTARLAEASNKPKARRKTSL